MVWKKKWMKPKQTQNTKNKSFSVSELLSSTTCFQKKNRPSPPVRRPCPPPAARSPWASAPGPGAWSRGGAPRRPGPEGTAVAPKSRGKTMGNPWEIHQKWWKSMGKPTQNGRKPWEKPRKNAGTGWLNDCLELILENFNWLRLQKWWMIGLPGAELRFSNKLGRLWWISLSHFYEDIMGWKCWWW